MFYYLFLFIFSLNAYSVTNESDLEEMPPGAIYIAGDRSSGAPYISGDTFRANCDFAFDELNNHLDFRKMEEGSTVFVNADILKRFFLEIHPHIPHPYILVTHNSDHPTPGRFSSYLDDDKIIGWFAQNVTAISKHPKLHPIPIGIANRRWLHGNIRTFQEMEKVCFQVPKRFLLYGNFSNHTHPERKSLADMFKNKDYCHFESSVKEHREYLMDLAQSKFVLSPRGNGLDCHRTWEALLMGSIPLVQESSLDPMYENLPVLIVRDWSEVSEEFLNMNYEKIISKKFQREKLYIDYWISLINSYKSTYKSKKTN